MSDVRYLLMHRKALTAAALHYNKILLGLPKSHQAWEYLRDRGIKPELVSECMLGFSPGEGLYEEMLSQGYLQSVLFAKNLVKMRKHKDLGCSDKPVDFFGKGRIIFPCLKNGRVLGMTSRICYETDNPSIPRYKMLKDNSFQFYSPDFIKSDHVVVVEGPMDVLALMSHGISSVCFLGTSGFKDEDAEEFKHCREIYCMPDADPGNKISRNANMATYIKIAEATGKMPYVLELPMGRDPADHFRMVSDGHRELSKLASVAKALDEHREWSDHLRKLREDQRKKELRTKTLRQGDSLEKYPIIPTLEALGVEVFEAYGARPTCRCFNPDHADAEPSVHIYESTQTFHCFGCNAGHDAIDAVRMVLGLDFKQAVDWLKEKLNEEQGS